MNFSPYIVGALSHNYKEPYYHACGPMTHFYPTEDIHELKDDNGKYLPLYINSKSLLDINTLLLNFPDGHYIKKPLSK